MPTNTNKNTAPRGTPTPDLYGPQPNPGYAPEPPHGSPARMHPEQENWLSELVDQAKAAQTYARGVSEALYRVSQGEEAYPDPQATAEAVIALARVVDSLASCTFEIARMIKHFDVKSDSRGLPR